eukprot:PhM_4_TR8359/c2_g1_i1/m.69556/K19756/RSPH4A; radial spoke head protein 4A
MADGADAANVTVGTTESNSNTNNAPPPTAATAADVAAHKAKAYLMRAEQNGESVYTHLFNVLHKVMEENPNNVVQHPDKFLAMSSTLRTSRFAHGAAPIHYRDAIAPDPRTVERSRVALDLYKQPEPEVVTSISKPRPGVTVTTTTVVPKPCPKFRSIVNDARYWRMCGVGLPDSEVFLLEQSITRHAQDNNLEEVQFMGRINGTGGNYYVVVSKRVLSKNEKVFEERNTMPLPPRKGVEVDMQSEPAWKGLNRYTFWVCSYAGGAWTALPDLTPQQLNASRSIKKLFTGDLEASVVSYPPFPWKEAVYLRAQLARIWSSTIVSPQGAIVQPDPPEDEDDQEEPEDGKPLPPKESKYLALTVASKEWAPPDEGVEGMNTLEGWVHHTQHIYKMGRATKPPERPVNDDDPEPDEDEPEKKEEEEKEMFQPVKGDKLFGIVNIPKVPTEEDEAAEDEAEEEAEKEGEEEEKEEEDDEVLLADDDSEEDPLKKKLRSWTMQLNNVFYKRHGCVVLRSVRWPGAYAFAANNGKTWGCIYVGMGVKRTHNNYAPRPAPKLQKEADDIVEFVDPTAANERLVLRGEEPKAADSEDEPEEEENEEDQ